MNTTVTLLAFLFPSVVFAPQARVFRFVAELPEVGRESTEMKDVKNDEILHSFIAMHGDQQFAESQ